MAADEAYARLKADLRRGRFAPETILNVHLIASELGVSISPVRDAMERLVGERLVQLRPEGGFQMPPMTEEAARDLYRWHATLIGWALRADAPATRHLLPGTELGTLEFGDSEAIALSTAEMFAEIGRRSGSIQVEAHIAAAADKLAALRIRETMLSGRRTELAALCAAIRDGDRGRLRDAVSRYHRRRQHHIDAIVAALYRAR